VDHKKVVQFISSLMLIMISMVLNNTGMRRKE